MPRQKTPLPAPAPAAAPDVVPAMAPEVPPPQGEQLAKAPAHVHSKSELKRRAATLEWDPDALREFLADVVAALP